MLHYLVTVADPKGHYFDVQLRADLPLSKLQTEGGTRWIELSLPAWIPGSYLIREFAKNILYVKSTINGADAACKKISKDCWRIDIDDLATQNENRTVHLESSWRVYAWDLSVRGAHLDETHGFFNGTSLFLCPQGFENVPIELIISRPEDDGLCDWTVASGLSCRPGTLKDEHGCPVLQAGGRVQFAAPDYDYLIDHPVEMGELQVESFKVLGVNHVFAVYGADNDLDLKRICNDLKPVCQAQITLFEPETKRAPFETYCFMLHATDSGYGGLEHRNSTALLCNASDLPQHGVETAPKGYEGFPGLCSHEYFQEWKYSWLHKPRKPS